MGEKLTDFCLKSAPPAQLCHKAEGTNRIFFLLSSDHAEIGLIVLRGIRLACTRGFDIFFTIVSDSVQQKHDPAGATSVGALDLTGTSRGRSKIYLYITLQILKEGDCVILDMHIYVLYGVLHRKKRQKWVIHSSPGKVSGSPQFSKVSPEEF